MITQTVYNKSCLSMTELADNSVHMVVTSPPYWGLRKYADVPDLIWDARNGCEHEWIDRIKPQSSGGTAGYRKDGGIPSHDNAATHFPLV